MSILNFAAITGNQVGGGVKLEATGMYQSTLCPYFVKEDAPDEWGSNIERLLELRHELRSLPGKRCAELQQLYDQPPEDNRYPHEALDLQDRWFPALSRLHQRIGRDPDMLKNVDRALSQLGDPTQKNHGYWKHILRSSAEKVFYGHGLPDLLEAWDYTYKLDIRMTDYEVE
jgi:hypothetical protein